MAPQWAHACDYHRVQPNTRQYTDGQGSKGNQPTLWTSVVALGTMAIYVGWCHILLGLFVSAFFSRWAALVFAGVMGLAFLPMRPWPGVLGAWVFSEWRRYFRFSYIFEENVSPYNNYVMAQFPHGACPIGTILAGSAIQTFWPEFNAHALVASFIFNVPGWRQMHAWVYAHPATRGWLMKLLTGGNNHSSWAHLDPQPEQQKQGQPHGLDREQEQRKHKGGARKNKGMASQPLPPAPPADATHSDSDHDSAASSSSSGSSSRSSSCSSSRSSSGSQADHPVTAVIAPRVGAAAAPQLARPPHPLSGHLRDQPVVCDQPLHSTVGRKIGVSVGILVGGIAELFLADPDVEHIVVKKRKGFVRAAVETGSYLLPTYYFGQSVMLKFGPRWLRSLSRKLRTSFGFMYGPFGLPVPYQVPIMMVCGKPVPVTRMSPDAPGFEAYVDQVHAQFVAEVVRIFHTHKVEYGWADRKLVVH